MSIFKSASKLLFLLGLAASHAEMSPKLAAFMKKSGLKKYCETHGLKEGECIKYVADIDSFARDKIFDENEPNRKKTLLSTHTVRCELTCRYRTTARY